jgi:hypothetical protein
MDRKTCVEIACLSLEIAGLLIDSSNGFSKVKAARTKAQARSTKWRVSFWLPIWALRMGTMERMLMCSAMEVWG